MQTSYIPYIISAIALLFSVYQFTRNNEKEDTTQLTTVLIKLESISDGVSEIKADIRNVKEDVNYLRERVAKVEASASSAHKRLDTISGDVHNRNID